MISKKEKYRYRNLPIPGGGYVPSFTFDEKDSKGFYIRTDVGGAYRFERKTERWIPLNDDVDMRDLRETYPIAIATDAKRPGALYIISGKWNEPHGKLAISADYGEHFEYVELPFRAHGNLSGRGTGSKLIVDRNDSKVLYYASQADGLWKSSDGGQHFERLEAMPEEYLTFVAQDTTGAILIVGSAGVTTAKPSEVSSRMRSGKVEEAIMRGPGLYVSYDAGAHFEVLDMPKDECLPGVLMPGSVPLRIAISENYLFVTTSVMPQKFYIPELAYSCDGGRILAGRVLRYPLQNGKVGAYSEITPPQEETGISGVALVPEKHMVCVSSANKRGGDSIYRSMDDGNTWEEILYGLQVGRMEFRTSYMRPEYNGGENLIHWISDLKINPNNPDEMWFNTGSGVFRTQNLSAETVVFSDWCDGLEETVHINVYAMPGGEVQCLDAVGDLGGFAFRDVDKQCANSFDDENGNRYITCLNADYSDDAPEHVVITARGNWTGKTIGGLIRTDDDCKTYQHIDLPYGISKELDDAFRNMEEPNTNAGWVATSAACKHIVWSVAERIWLPREKVIVSHDGGETFHKITIIEPENVKDELPTDSLALRQYAPQNYRGFKVFADRVKENLFYGFDEIGRIYLSTDYGDTFVMRTERMPEFEFSLVDTADHTDVKFASGEVGVAYISMRELGLYKFVYDLDADKISLQKLSAEGDVIYRIGLGLPAPGADYYKPGKAIYMAALIDGTYGYFRTCDEGSSYVLLSEEHQHFGEVNAIDADSRIYGRFFIGTGGRGLLYGEPAAE